MKNRTSGFTLIELAIVLAIIALLIAGTLLGRDLIRNAELQKTASNFIMYTDAIKQFKDKYKYLPGDMPTATSYWGTGTCTTATSDSPIAATCNGNGDGLVADQGPSDPMGLLEPAEAMYLWQHLTNSKFLSGAYTGRYAVGSTIWKPGVNVPLGINKGGYTFYYIGNEPDTLAYFIPDSTYLAGGGNVTGVSFPANYGHVITFGRATNNDGTENPPVGMAISGADALAIDTKIDDGKPGRGILLSTVVIDTDTGTDWYCATSTDYITATYNTETDFPYCTLIFITGF